MLHYTGVDGVTVARGAIGNPWIFAEARALAAGQPLPDPPTLFEQRDVIAEHYSLAEELYGPEKMRPHDAQIRHQILPAPPPAPASPPSLLHRKTTRRMEKSPRRMVRHRHPRHTPRNQRATTRHRRRPQLAPGQSIRAIHPTQSHPRSSALIRGHFFSRETSHSHRQIFGTHPRSRAPTPVSSSTTGANGCFAVCKAAVSLGGTYSTKYRDQ